MRAIGTDRVRVMTDGRIVLASRFPKGWQARVPKTLTTPEHPGTAVLWDGEYYEVVEVAPMPPSGSRYVLDKWREEHAIRVSSVYDEANEAQRLAEYHAALRRERQRIGATFGGLFVGHLPAVVQEAMASELGILPVRLTMLSLLVSFAIFASIIFYMVAEVTNGHPMPPLLVILAAAQLGEMSLRYLVVMSQQRPIASSLGFLGYTLLYALAGRGRWTSPFARETGLSTASVLPPEPDQQLRDAFIIREPMVTLLPARDQELLARRFDYDHRRQGYAVAWGFLIFALLGIGTSIATLKHHGASLSALLSLGAALFIAIEQPLRMIEMRTRPAGSVIGHLVRPFVRRLFM